jgi:AcrR family transcriptional regulator
LFSSCIGPSEFRTFASQLTNRHEFDKTESISAIDLDNWGLSPVTRFLGRARKRSQPARQKPRTDAQQNRERILEVAKEAFARSGASTSLDDMAKQVGVGAGTLYRHFPTSDALLEAVYRTEVEKLAAAERKLAQGMRPIEALRSWMLLFVDYIATKQIIAPALKTLIGGPSKAYEASRAQIAGAIHATTAEERISGRAEPHPESPNQRQVGAIRGRKKLRWLRSPTGLDGKPWKNWRPLRSRIRC